MNASGLLQRTWVDFKNFCRFCSCTAFMLRVYVLLRVFIVFTQRSWAVVRNLSDCLLLSDLPRSWVKIKSKTECVAAQHINHALWYTSNVKPDTWLLSKRTYHGHHLNQKNHSSFCVHYCIYIK